MSVIDISLPLCPGMPVWPGSPELELERISTIADDGVNGTRLSCDSHAGTHLDAPLHFIENGSSVEMLPLDRLIGRAVLVEFPEADAISAEWLDSVTLPNDVKRLLFKTRNSTLWARGESAFTKDYVALTEDAAEWIVNRSIGVVGIDYLSIGRFDGDGSKTHRTLLQAGVIVVEGLDLSRVEPGEYELICLPLRVVGAEGAPARAVLRTYE